ncbi:Ketohexokinase (Hepatic fructokinase) [Candidatus Methylomirabilis oxygeniifera]|uniref:Ketohexokinase (Hepatic fructokinase) n=1 Tax=Methylomirabilis oxygeniifera TaxID=671143 RepID=D5MJL1_METO1|nr:Ketohexokinase (Hepatic fructokinase) [Candidatus Methylomirabilis oxyfera]
MAERSLEVHMARILAIGGVTLDLIFTVAHYPDEDAELRAKGLRICPGGNAANTLVVLSQLGHACAFGGVLADDSEATPIIDHLVRHRIDLTACRYVRGRPPTSCVLLSLEGGTRTIVHHRELPEYGDDDFRRIDLTPFDWVHFEGRDASEATRMVRRVRESCPGLPCSVEVEKPRPGIEAIFADATVLIFSRAYAGHLGFDVPRPFLSTIREQAPQADLIVTWGKEGAYGLDRQGEIQHSPAYPPIEIKDTLGAGDTFNAGLIDAYLKGRGLAEALSHACRLAGTKCGQIGLEGLQWPRTL